MTRDLHEKASGPMRFARSEMLSRPRDVRDGAGGMSSSSAMWCDKPSSETTRDVRESSGSASEHASRRSRYAFVEQELDRGVGSRVRTEASAHSRAEARAGVCRDPYGGVIRKARSLRGGLREFLRCDDKDMRAESSTGQASPERRSRRPLAEVLISSSRAVPSLWEETAGGPSAPQQGSSGPDVGLQSWARSILEDITVGGAGYR